jgi:formate-dependent nitrite reductase membrane component NrfD
MQQHRPRSARRDSEMWIISKVLRLQRHSALLCAPLITWIALVMSQIHCRRPILPFAPFPFQLRTLSTWSTGAVACLTIALVSCLYLTTCLSMWELLTGNATLTLNSIPKRSSTRWARRTNTLTITEGITTPAVKACKTCTCLFCGLLTKSYKSFGPVG